MNPDTRRDVEYPEPISIPLLKVTFDKTVALLTLALLVPLFGLIALAIKIDGFLHPEDRGPVFYEENRVRQGHIFTLYKFRVVKRSAMYTARQRRGYNHVKPLERSEESKTRVGRWLQRWYLDEIPQLVNILKGDMSLVGPRPWPVHMVEREVFHSRYHKSVLRPGLTGLVQAHKDELDELGGSKTLDSAYIEACRTLSPIQMLLLDLRIMITSLRILIRGEGL